MAMEPVKERFQVVYDRVVAAHHGVHGGHDIYHAARVAYWAWYLLYCTWSKDRLADLAWVAAMCHNADRLKEHIYGRDNVPDNATEELVRSWIEETSMTDDEKNIVVNAVLRHSLPNAEDDDEVTIALKDADRIVNLALDVVIRSGQFHPEIPAVDYELFLSDPEATYRKPKSCLKDIDNCREWADEKKPMFCCRTGLGLKVAKERVAALEAYENELRNQLIADKLKIAT